jgi:hypothetical protein
VLETSGATRRRDNFGLSTGYSSLPRYCCRQQLHQAQCLDHLSSRPQQELGGEIADRAHFFPVVRLGRLYPAIEKAIAHTAPGPSPTASNQRCCRAPEERAPAHDAAAVGSPCLGLRARAGQAAGHRGHAISRWQRIAAGQTAYAALGRLSAARILWWWCAHRLVVGEPAFETGKRRGHSPAQRPRP